MLYTNCIVVNSEKMSFKNISPHNSGSIDCTTQEFETLGRSCKRLCGSARSIMSSDATRMILSSTAAPDSTCSMHSTETNKKVGRAVMAIRVGIYDLDNISLYVNS